MKKILVFCFVLFFASDVYGQDSGMDVSPTRSTTEKDKQPDVDKAVSTQESAVMDSSVNAGSNSVNNVESGSEVENAKMKLQRVKKQEDKKNGVDEFSDVSESEMMQKDMNKHTILISGSFGVINRPASTPGGSSAIGVGAGMMVGYEYKLIDFIRVSGGYVFKTGISISTETGALKSVTGYFGGHGFFIGGSFTTLGTRMFEAELTGSFLFGEAGSYQIDINEARSDNQRTGFLFVPRLAIGYRGAPDRFAGIGVRAGVGISATYIGEIVAVPDVYAGLLFTF